MVFGETFRTDSRNGSRASPRSDNVGGFSEQPTEAQKANRGATSSRKLPAICTHPTTRGSTATSVQVSSMPHTDASPPRQPNLRNGTQVRGLCDHRTRDKRRLFFSGLRRRRA
ncbi:hypothetical protein PHLGIDRAFT_179382 [Phlebiopsis gigantea 11061_1 CR5-6]|uniref:Uncharacterized protein n=1 Tax=Phlebiopsis gigantea (strain 11061_1 CR5-6) TaxID=745531 RepID=A0A0C3S458_PHLG1|nr:hypothetical protein PHLGIDRAFT_179382 [Phlebiopsis gigantea 11061_1 CR5-6]